MTQPRRLIDPRLAIVAAGVLALILYGSLYPFQFHSSVPFSSLLHLFQATALEHLQRGDLISNILLYLPLGFFTARAIRRGSPALRVIVVTLFASVLAVSIELTQYFDAARGPSLIDAFGNTIGALLGAVAGASLRHVSFAMLLLAAWIGDRLLPFVPSFDLHKYAAALKPLFVAPQFDALSAFTYLAFWLAAAALIEAIAGIEHSRRIIVVLLTFILAARVIIEGTALSASEVAGAALAVLMWITILSRLSWRIPAVAALFVVFISLEALRPFHFLPAPRSFTWVPFIGFMEGPREGGSRVFLQKTYMYGALVWLLARGGCSYALTAASAATLVFCLRLIQVYLPGRSAESGDAVMVLILAGVMALLEPQHPARPAPCPPSPASAIPQ